MKHFSIFLLAMVFPACTSETNEVPAHLKQVDQVIWIIDDLDNVISHWQALGFNQIRHLDTVETRLVRADQMIRLRLALANLGGARIVWIQPTEDQSLFSDFLENHGQGAMSLVHRLEGPEQMKAEVNRLSGLGVDILEELTIFTGKGDLHYTLMDTREEGKYVLGFTFSEPVPGMDSKADNRHHLKINQYAFAIRDADKVSEFWAKLGFPEFQINHPVLGDTRYYGEIVDHELIQGWQRHGTVAYEWCIPVKPPIVYEDHIKLHGEGIHHLAFSVSDMDAALQDYAVRGYVNTMGGTWGEKGKPGSGRYEYIGLEEAGGVTMELLWNYTE
jgi:catechol 2,3-dioxygenase-like lactoylglutathione lyase family enzyme